MYFKDVLPNGVRVLTEEMDNAYSVTVGIWVATGSNYEDPALAGVSHVLEHMLFKGTKKRTAKQLAEAMEEVGGQMNAFTSKEHTCYYVRCLEEHFELAVDLLADMFLESTLDEVEFAREKNVVLEEISMYEDSPDDLVTELFSGTLWPKHQYGLPVIGTTASVEGLSWQELKKYYKTVYAPAHTVVSVAGKVEHQRVLAVIGSYLGSFAGDWDKPVLFLPESSAGKNYIYKDIEQVHLCLGLPGVPAEDDDFYVMNVLTNVLGGGVSSRLFQEAREKRGLTYSIYSYHGAYCLGGYLMSYASTSPVKVPEVLEVMGKEMKDIATNGITTAELNRSKEQLKGSLLLSMENTSNVMIKLGKSETNFDHVITIEEMVEKIKQVTLEDVERLAKTVLLPEKLVLAQVGPKEYTADLLSIW